MKYRKLGSSDLEISVLSMGCWQLGDTRFWDETDENEAHKAVHAAIDHGINFFDTAEMYGFGASERVLGAALGKQRQNVYVASKVWPDHAAPAELRKACEQSLINLRTDYLDLYQVHWPIRNHSLHDAAHTLEKLKAEGKIRYIGISNFGVSDMTEWMDVGNSVSNQLAYNLLFRAIEYEIVPVCKKHAMGVLAYMPVMQGLLAGCYETADDIPQIRRRTRHFAGTREGVMHDDPGAEAETFAALAAIRSIAERHDVSMAALALAWVIEQPGITAALIGARKAGQLIRNLDALHVEIDEGTIAELNDATEPLKEKLGDNADMWFSGDKQRVK